MGAIYINQTYLNFYLSRNYYEVLVEIISEVEVQLLAQHNAHLFFILVGAI
jgi:hypothetical protein